MRPHRAIILPCLFPRGALLGVNSYTLQQFNIVMYSECTCCSPADCEGSPSFEPWGRLPRGLGGDRLGSGHIRQTIQSPDRLYKAPEYQTKPKKHYTKTQKTMQGPRNITQIL